jgi:hypothetical protein
MAACGLETKLLLYDTAGVKTKKEQEMNSVSTLPSNRKRISVQVASFACGLALAAIAFISGGEILDGGANSDSTPSQAKVTSLGLVMAEPDFGTVAVDYNTLNPTGHAASSVGLGMPEPDFGSMTASYPANGVGVGMSEPDFGLVLKAYAAIVDPHFGTGAESVSAIEGEY